MKNKDGIVIKPGQVWRRPQEKYQDRVLAFDAEVAVCRSLGGGVFSCRADANIFNTLIRSHDGADLDQARKDGWEVWVEGMAPSPNWEKDGWEKWFCGVGDDPGEWIQCDGGKWPHDDTYRRKLDPVDDLYSLEPEQPSMPERFAVEVNWAGGLGSHIRPFSPHYRCIGYKYAECDCVCCTGPNAFWDDNYDRSESVLDFDNGSEMVNEIFATHAVYRLVK